MSDTEYTPTTDDIREYVTYGDPKPWEAPSAETRERESRRKAAFDRWLAAHDAELNARVRAEALEQAADEIRAVLDGGRTLGGASDDWLRSRAAAIREAGKQ
jgi:hypothetical protein